MGKSKKEVLVSINPATLETIGEVEATTPEKVENIVQEAHEAFPTWRDTGLTKRAEIIKRAQKLLLNRAEEFAELITLEMGRPLVESLVLEIEASLDLIGFYADRAHKFLGDRKVPLHHLLLKRRKSYIHFQPLGVVGVISPWNWPLWIPLGGIVPALLAGNAVVLKPSEFTPFVGIKIRELFLEAGIPDTVFHLVQGGAPTGKALVGSKVEKIFFTGSTEVGRKIMLQAASALKKTVLELGGSDPAIVCEDADVENASSGIVWGGFTNCGQNCNSIERVYIHEAIADDFIDFVVKKVNKLRIGNGMDETTDVGPLVSEPQRVKMETIVNNAIDRGAKVLLGGHRITDLRGYFFEPTVILYDKSIPQPSNEEIFGPIVCITPVSNDNEAVELANRSSFGLAASVWTSDVKRGERISHCLEMGSVMINDVHISFGIPEAERSGIKNSAVGWVQGERGLDEMVNIQYVNRDPQFHTQKLWWFPYSSRMIEAMKAGLDFLFAQSIRRKMKSVPQVLRSFTSYLLFNRKRSDKL